MTRLRVLLARLLGLFSRDAGRDRELHAEIDAGLSGRGASWANQVSHGQRPNTGSQAG